MAHRAFVTLVLLLLTAGAFSVDASIGGNAVHAVALDHLDRPSDCVQALETSAADPTAYRRSRGAPSRTTAKQSSASAGIAPGLVRLDVPLGRRLVWYRPKPATPVPVVLPAPTRPPDLAMARA